MFLTAILIWAACLLGMVGPSWSSLIDDDDKSATSEQDGEDERSENETEERSPSEDDDDASLGSGLIASAAAASIVHFPYQVPSPCPGYSEPPFRPPNAIRG